MIEFFVRGGLLFMLPLLGASLLVIAVAIDRFRHLHRAHVDYDSFVDGLRGGLQRGGVREALEEASKTPGPVARLWEEGLRMARLPFPLIRERMESVAIQELSVSNAEFIGSLSWVNSLRSSASSAQFGE